MTGVVMGDLTQATQRYLAADRKLARKYQLNARAPGTFENHKRAWRCVGWIQPMNGLCGYGQACRGMSEAPAVKGAGVV